MVAPTILAAVDFTRGAESVCAAAADIARRAGGTVRLVHVMQLRAGLTPDTLIKTAREPEPAPAREVLRRDADRHIAPLLDFIHARGVDTSLCLRMGAVVEELVACAKEADAWMLVVGTHDAKGIRRLFGRGVTEGVIREAPCPVLVVREDEAEGIGLSTGQSQVLTEGDG